MRDETAHEWGTQDVFVDGRRSAAYSGDRIELVLKESAEMKTRTIWALSLSLLFVPIISNAQARKRVVIMPIADRDASQGMDPSQLMMLGTHVGPRISDELISKLAAMGTFEMIDQEHLNSVIQQQNQSYGDRFSPSGAAKLGKLLRSEERRVGKECRSR